MARRALRALAVQFTAFGMLQMSWLARLPSVRADLGVTSAQLGVFLVAGAVGSLVAIVASGAAVSRFGARAVLAVATCGNVIGFGLLAASVALGSVPGFVVAVLLNGAFGALINTAINLSGALLEQRLERTILPRFHAFFSIGAALGALAAAGFSALGASVALHVAVLVATITAIRLPLIGAATRASVVVPLNSSAPADAVAPSGAGAGSTSSTGRFPDTDERRRRFRTRATVSTGTVPAASRVRQALGAWLEPRTLLIGLVLLAAALSEGSANNWLAIAVVDGFEAREAVGALAYGTFVATMTVVRFGGTRLLDRYGRVAVLRVSGVTALVGLGLFGLAPELWLAWTGIVLWGAGAALANPIGIAAASDEPRHAAARVSVVTSFLSFAHLTAPPVLGLLVDQLGARHALLLICAATLVSIAVAGRAAPPRLR